MMFRFRKTVVMFGLIALSLMVSACAAFSANPPPTLGTVNPSSGNIQVGQWTTLTCTYSDLSGAADLRRCSLLINNAVSNTGGAHLIYSKLSNQFIMKNNAGVESTPVLKGTATTIETDNASLDCGGTSVTAVGNTITIVWRFKVKAPMTGKSCNLYMNATDSAGGVAAWLSKGTAFINAISTVGTPSPSSVTIGGGVWNTVICTYSDANGANDLWTCSFLLNNVLANSGGAHFMYSRNTNKLYVKNNTDVLVGGVLLGTVGSIESQNAVLDCANTLVTKSGNNLTIAWRFKTKTPMNGKNCGMYLQAVDNHGGTCPWANKGTLRVNCAPSLVSVTPASGTIPSDVAWTLTTAYADLDGSAGIATCNLLLNTSVSNVGGAHFIYNENTNKLYMKNNAGALVPSLGVTVGQAQVIDTENATLYCEYTTVSKVGNTLTVTWRIRIKPVMKGKVCNEYMTVTDDFGAVAAWASKGSVTVATATAADYISAGKGAINKMVTMEPFDEAAAAVLLSQAYSNFLKAKNLDTNNAQANFGLAITDAATTAQGLINKYKDQFADGGSAPATLKYAVGAMQIMNLQNIADPGKEPLGGLVTTYRDSAIELNSAPTSTQLIGMQADVRDVVRPMLSRVGGYLNIVETYGGASFAFGIGPASWDGYKIVDVGDVYLFHGALLAARWALAIPSSYSVNSGAFNFDNSPMALDLNHDGLLTPSEYMPPSPFMTLTSSATMTGAKADMITAADKITAGINATLAETLDNYDLIPWHTAGGPKQADLLMAKAYAASLKLSMNASTVITWDTEDGVKSLKVFLGAWNTTPPADLKTLAPTQEIVRWRNDWAGNYDYGTTEAENGWPDITIGGMFPDGLPMENDFKYIWNTGFSGGSLVGVIVNPSNGATNVSTEPEDSFWISYTDVLPAVISIQLQRKFAGTWRSVKVGYGWRDHTAQVFYPYVDESLWPNSDYRIILTDEATHQTITQTFKTGADAPF